MANLTAKTYTSGDFTGSNYPIVPGSALASDPNYSQWNSAITAGDYSGFHPYYIPKKSSGYDNKDAMLNYAKEYGYAPPSANGGYDLTYYVPNSIWDKQSGQSAVDYNPSKSGGLLGSILDNPIIDLAAQFTPAAPFFDAAKGVYDVSQGDYMGAALSALGAYNVPSGGFSLSGVGDTLSSIPGKVSNLFSGDTSALAGTNLPSIGTSGGGSSGVDPGMTAAMTSGGGVDPNLTAAMTPATGSATSTSPGYIQSAINTLTNPKNLPAEIGAVGSLLSASNAGKSNSSATAPLSTVQAQQQALASQLVAQYQKGTLTAADAYKADQWEAQQTAAKKQYYAAAGLGNSDMLVEALGDVKTQAAAMRSQAQQAYLTEAISALGGAGSTAGALVNANVAQDTSLQNAQNAFFSNLARLSTTTDSQGAA